MNKIKKCTHDPFFLFNKFKIKKGVRIGRV